MFLFVKAKKNLRDLLIEIFQTPTLNKTCRFGTEELPEIVWWWYCLLPLVFGRETLWDCFGWHLSENTDH